MYRRVETTPKQQLAELRRAYERYAALAEQLKDGANNTIGAELQRALVQDACRIAAAYKKSVANSCARMENPRPSKSVTTHLALLATGLTVIVAIIAGGAVTITLRPDLFRLILPIGAEPAITRNSVVVTKDITPYVPAAVKPILSAPAPERARPALGLLQAVGGQHSVAPAKSAITDSQAAMRSTTHKTPVTDVGSSPRPGASTEAASSVSAKSADAAPGGADSEAVSATSFSSTRMVATSGQLLPNRPNDTNRAVDQGITQVHVSISAGGAITDCHVVETSGSPGLDASACSLVQRYWQWPPHMHNSQPASGATNVSVIWNLAAAK